MPSTSSESSSDSPLINLDGIHLTRDGKAILQAVDLSVHAGEIVTLIGPNGAGKSSLIKVALNLWKPDRGAVAHRADLSVGYVPQDIRFDPTLPLTVHRFLQLQRHRPQKTIDAILDDTGAAGLGDAPLSALSVGEMRRVLLARALLREPNLLIMDEPGAGMDIRGRANLYRLIQTIRERRRCGVLLVSHDMLMVMAATDRVFCLNRHLCCSGKPEAVRRHPQFVALFGNRAARELAVYQHQHDHEHDLHGDVEPVNDGVK